MTSDADNTLRTLLAPVAGCVVTLLAEPGRAFAAGQPLLLLESMKMEIPLDAPATGMVLEWFVGIGDMVDSQQPLARWQVAPDAQADAATGPTGGSIAGRPVREAAPSVTRRDPSLSLVGGTQSANAQQASRPQLQRLQAQRRLLEDAARPDAMLRRHASGLRSARENLADLLDADSFVEYGAHAVAAQRSRRDLHDLQRQTPADGLVCGTGLVDGLPVAALAYDYTVLAGTQGWWNHAKSDRLLEIAQRQQLPVVWFVEGGGGRPGDVDSPVVAGLHCSTFARWASLSGQVPRLAIVAGRCFAGNAALAGASDLIIGVEGLSLGMGGPAMIEGGGMGRVDADEVGPLSVMETNGVVDVTVASEAEAVRVARELLSLLTAPAGNKVTLGRRVRAEAAEMHQGAEPDEPADQHLLRAAMPANRNALYDPRSIVRTLSDPFSWIELRPRFGPGVVTGLARIGGHAVAIAASDPKFLGGALDAPACDKLARFMQLADSFGLPFISLVDSPGFMVGTASEQTALVRHAGRVFLQASALRVPVLSVLLRRGYGLGAMALTGGHFHAPTATAAWPTGEFGAMGLEGSVKLGFRRELEAAPAADRDALFQRLLDEAMLRGDALNMASHLEIDDVIDPAETRDWLLRNLAVLSSKALAPRRPLLDAW